MRRFIPILAIAGAAAGALLVVPAPAYACPQPEEGQPHCCEYHAVTIDVDHQQVTVTFPPDPRRCE